MDNLEILAAYTEAYKIVNKAETQAASGTMPVYQKVCRIKKYIDSAASEVLHAIESPEYVEEPTVTADERSMLRQYDLQRDTLDQDRR